MGGRRGGVCRGSRITAAQSQALRRFRFSHGARRDLREIAEYSREYAGESVAFDIASKIRETCRMIAETPGAIGPRRAEFGPDIRSFPVPPHIIFFRFAEDSAEIVRILHGRRDLRPDLF